MYIYNKMVYQFNGNKESLKEILKESDVGYIGSYNKSRGVRDFGIERELIYVNINEGSYVRVTKDEYPHELFTSWSIPTNVYKLTATESNMIPLFLNEDIFIMNCQYDEEGIVADSSIEGLAFFDIFDGLSQGAYIEIVSGEGDIIFTSIDLMEEAEEGRRLCTISIG